MKTASKKLWHSVIEIFFIAVLIFPPGHAFALSYDSKTDDGLLFSSGFEANTMLPVPRKKIESIQGRDESTGLDWSTLPAISGLAPAPNFLLTYWGGKPHVNSTSGILPDTDSTYGNVLMFQVNSDDGKHPNARTSMEVKLNPNTFDELGVRYQMKIDSSFLDFPTDSSEIPNRKGSSGPTRLWWVVSEAWLRDTHGKRASLPVEIKRSNKNEYVFKSVKLRLMDQSSSDKIAPLWTEAPKAEAPSIPIGQWVTIEMLLKNGPKGTGRFYLALNQKVVFDITNRDISYGDYQWYLWSPMKLYLDLSTIGWMSGRGTPARVYYDNFEVWQGMPGSPAAFPMEPVAK